MYRGHAARLEAKLASTWDVYERAVKERDELRERLSVVQQERNQFAKKVDEIAPDMRRYIEERDIARERLAKLEHIYK
jgi:uncharacterized coiled-coil DUF342 family protein